MGIPALSRMLAQPRAPRVSPVALPGLIAQNGVRHDVQRLDDSSAKQQQNGLPERGRAERGIDRTGAPRAAWHRERRARRRLIGAWKIRGGRSHSSWSECGLAHLPRSLRGGAGERPLAQRGELARDVPGAAQLARRAGECCLNHRHVITFAVEGGRPCRLRGVVGRLVKCLLTSLRRSVVKRSLTLQGRAV